MITNFDDFLMESHFYDHYIDWLMNKFNAYKEKFHVFLGKLKEESVEVKKAFRLVVESLQGKRQLTHEDKVFIGEQIKEVFKTIGFIIILELPLTVVVLFVLKYFKLNKYIIPKVFMDSF